MGIMECFIIIFILITAIRVINEKWIRMQGILPLCFFLR